ncbi:MULTISPECIES: hypothetical protein [Enterococcus]|uniref:hypothetical protein n=1 Tax=Enterococcus TaxID=1350 RepID=UPI00065E3BEA|nr:MULTISPECIES: hypothetical protein [Enterococcus]KAF1300867.1 hypothetical protein BAU16_10825 [Enterococcus sp. JM9B]
MKYYDVTFQGLSGRGIIKRTVPSEKDPFDAWEDACVKITEDELQLLVNETYIVVKRQYLARIDIEEVKDPIDEAMERKDELTSVINALSNMGF